MLKKGSQVALVACSNALTDEKNIQTLVAFFKSQGLEVRISPHVIAPRGKLAAKAKTRADSVMHYFCDPRVDAIFDVSGGDLANEVLPELDYQVAAQSRATFWGYSDVTTVINALHTRAGKASVLYQARHLPLCAARGAEWERWLCAGEESLFTPEIAWVQGRQMSGVTVGGNVRCLLKLAGTPYWPDMRGKILVLEARSGGEAQIRTYLQQLRQMDVFSQVSGILLGTFSQLEQSLGAAAAQELLQAVTGPKLPLAVTRQIGHGSDAKALWIGRELQLQRSGE